MAKEKGRPGILIYHDELEAIELTLHKPGESELADLLMAIYHYSEFGEMPNFEGRSVAFTRLFNRMAGKVDAQEAAYRRKVEGAKKGGEAKARKDRAETASDKGTDDAMREIMRQSISAGFTGMRQDEKDLIQAELKNGYSATQIIEAMRKTAAASNVKDRKAYLIASLHNL